MIPNEPIWGLDQEPRMPLRAIGWETAPATLPLKRPKFYSGEQPFAGFAFPGSTQRVVSGVKSMLDQHLEEFRTAAAAIKPDAWRLLHYRGTFCAEAVTEFRFHPEQALRQLCECNGDTDDPPGSWVGTDRDITEICAELEITLREIGPKPSCAVWLVLSVVQRAGLTQAEILQTTWWDPDWLQSFIQRVRFID